MSSWERAVSKQGGSRIPVWDLTERWGMSSTRRIKSTEELVRELPPELQAEVRQFVEYLRYKKRRRSKGPVGQSWAGALKEYRDQYTSIELQKRALEWWGDSALSS